MEWWAHIATIVATALAALGLGATAWSTWLQARALDFAALQQLVRDIRENDDRFSASKNDAEKFEAELYNRLNFLEVLAAAINGRLMRRVTTKFATELLVTELGLLLAQDDIKRTIREAATSPETFAEIRAFMKANEAAVNRATKRARLRSSLIDNVDRASA